MSPSRRPSWQQGSEFPGTGGRCGRALHHSLSLLSVVPPLLPHFFSECEAWGEQSLFPQTPSFALSPEVPASPWHVLYCRLRKLCGFTSRGPQIPPFPASNSLPSPLLSLLNFYSTFKPTENDAPSRSLSSALGDGRGSFLTVPTVLCLLLYITPLCFTSL